MKDHRHPTLVWENIVDHVFSLGWRICASPSHLRESSNTVYTLPKIKSKQNAHMFAYAYIYLHVFISMCEYNNNQK